ncbi:MAG: hypothetical protein ACK6CU_14160 [Deltaproteobacteria bacterium]|jgi:hypothetical protein
MEQRSKKMNSARRVMLAVSIALLATAMPSCGTEDWQAIEAGDPDDPRAREHVARLDIRITSGTFPSGCDSVAGTCPADSFAAGVLAGCTAPNTWGNNTCGLGAINASRRMCVAQTLLRLTAILEPETVAVSGGSVVVPVQDVESQAELARLARNSAYEAANIALDALNEVNCSGTAMNVAGNSTVAPLPPTGSPLFRLTQGEHTAHYVRESLQVLRDAQDAVQRTALAVADAQRSRSADPAQAEAVELNAFASRAFAAHSLVGGSNGLPGLRGVQQTGFFPRGRLSAEGRLALRYLRTAALNPVDIANIPPIPVQTMEASFLTIDQLVYGRTTTVSDVMASVRGRLGVMLPNYDLFTAMTAAQVYAILGVSPEAFVEARAYLAAEQRAFDRHPSRALAAERLPSGDLTSSFQVPLPSAVSPTLGQSITLFASTRSAPVQPLPVWWAAVARYDNTLVALGTSFAGGTAGPAWTWAPASGQTTVPQGLTYGTETQTAGSILVGGPIHYAAALESIASRIQTTLTRIDGFSAADRALAGVATTRNNLGSTLGDIGAPTASDDASDGPAGRARVCIISQNATTATLRFDVELAGVATSDLAIVSSRDALDCAVRGTIERVPCQAGEIGAVTPFGALGAGGITNVTTGSITGVGLSSWQPTNRPNADVVQYFVLRRRAGYAAHNLPGGYEPVVGWLLPKPTLLATNHYTNCVYTPISTAVDTQVAESIAPDPAFPGDAATSCTGEPNDLRLPLENELSDDGGSTENSWRFYLSMAQQAASEADQLGETLIDEGLQMEVRSEAAVDELERICGVGISVSPTQSLPATVEAAGGCPTGYFRRAGVTTGTCFLDPVGYAIATRTRSQDSAALATCLGDDPEQGLNNTSFTTLGDRDLCLWYDPANPSSVCAQPTNLAAQRECPFPATAGSCPASDIATGVSATPLLVNQRLGLFATPPEPLGQSTSNSQDNAFPCELLARARANPASLTDPERDQIRNLPFLTAEGFRTQAAQLSVSVTAGDFVQIRMGRSTIVSTGSEAGPGSRWPMVSPDFGGAALCPAGGVGWPIPSSAMGFRTALQTHTGPLFCLSSTIPSLSTILNGNWLGDADPRRARAALNNLLIRAVVAARVLSGAGVRGLRIPYYTSRDEDLVYFERESFGQLPGTTLTFQSESGSRGYDQRGDPDGPSVFDNAMSGMVAQYLTGTTQEWMHCDYRGAACRVFDAAAGSPTSWARPSSGSTPPSTGVPSRGMPFIVHTLGADAETPSAEAVASEHFVRAREMLLFGGRTSPSWGTRGYALGTDESRYSRYLQNADINDAYPGNLTGNDYMNGIELACYGARLQVPNPIVPNCNEPPPMATMRDLLGSSPYLECVAATAERRAARTVIRGLPASVMNEVRQGGSSVVGQSTGEISAQTAEIRAALLALRAHQMGIANDLRDYAAVIRTTQNAVRQSHIATQIEDINLNREIAGQSLQCLASIANAVSESIGKFGITSGLATGVSAATCLNSIFQSVSAAQINALRDQAGALEIDSAFANADREFVRAASSIQNRSIAIGVELARIDAAMTRLRTLQAEARNAVSRALFLDNATTGRAFPVNTVMRARYDTTLARYQAAHLRALRLAFIARRALEQRLGMNLEEMSDDLVTVNAPSEWANELCTLTPIDYERVRNAGDPTLASPDDYSGLFVGDYVRRLEQVFVGYSFSYPFQDGTDTAVISVRDDVRQLRRPCETDLPNLLYHSDEPHVLATSVSPGWLPRGCVATPATDACTTVSELTGSVPTSPSPVRVDPYSLPTGFTVSFGSRATLGSRHSQIVSLERGRYRLSWFERTDSLHNAGAGLSVRALDAASGVELAPLSPGRISQATGWTSGWTRWNYFFDVPADADVEIAVTPGARDTAVGAAGTYVVLAGLQLEAAAANFSGNLDTPVPPATVGQAMRFPPGRFYATGAERRGVLPVCADDGTMFRGSAFTRGCVRVCRDGYDGTCRASEALTRCYLQTTVDVTSDALERTLTYTPSGFAAGNFNYRIESVGVNLVGTGLRDCSAGATGGCFGAGHFSISLVHEGPWLVRNANGNLYDAPLFTGRVESARALAAERFLSNPLSSADQALIQPYVRHELRGRPLGGSLLIRIWEDEGFRFDRLEDVQLVLNYRYWTHQR